MNRIWLIALFIAVLCVSVLAGENYSPGVTENTDWIKGLVQVSAVYNAENGDDGLPVDRASVHSPTLTESRYTAYRNAHEETIELLSTVLTKIRINPVTSIGDLIEQDLYARERFAELVDQKTRIRETPRSYLSAKCDATFRIGELISLFPQSFVHEPFPGNWETSLATEYTSLIIDVRSENISPMLLPSIYDQTGAEVYSSRYVNPSAAARWGVVQYCYSEEEALSNKRSGDNPYIACALSSLNGSPILSMKDIKRIMGHKKTVANLEQCRVLFLISKIKGNHEQR